MASIADSQSNKNSDSLNDLQNLLLAALSSDRDQQKSAEKQINETMKDENGYGHALILISIDQNRPYSARHMALTVLKRYISEAWLFVPRNEKKAFHPDEKTIIKELSIKGLGMELEIIRTGFGMVVAEIAKYDWPDDWPTLFEEINNYIHSGQENFVRGAIKCLSMFSDFLDAKTLPFIGPVLFPTLTKILTERHVFDAQLRMQTGKIVHSVVVEFLMVKDSNKAFYDLMVQLLPALISNIFLSELNPQLCHNFGIGELGVQIQVVRTLKVILKDCVKGLLNQAHIHSILEHVTICLHKYVTLYQKYAVSPAFLSDNHNKSPASVFNETEMHDEDGNEISLEMLLVEIIGLYVDTLLVGEGIIRRYTRSYVLQNLSPILKSIISAMYINKVQEEDWANDLETYIMDEDKLDELKRSSTARDESQSFIDTIVRLYSSDVVLLDLLNNQLPYFTNLARQRRENIYGNNAGDNDWWKPIEGILSAIKTVGWIYKEHRRKVDDSDNTANNNVEIPDVDSETLLKFRQSALQKIILKEITSPSNVYLTATALSAGNSLSAFHTKEHRKPFLNAMIQSLHSTSPLPIRITACRQVTPLYSLLDPDDKLLIIEPVVMGVANLCATESAESQILEIVLATLHDLISEIKTPEIIGKLEPTVTTLLLKKWEQCASDENVVFAIVDVIRIMSESQFARVGMQERLLPAMFHLLQTRDKQVGGNVGASLEVFQHIIGNSTPPLANPIVIEVFPIVCELVGTNDDSAILINATNCLTCFARLCVNNELNQNFHFRGGANNATTVTNGIEAILSVTFRLLDISNASMPDQAIVSVGHLVYHIISNMKDVIGETNILKLLQLVVLRMATARFSSCTNNLISCILKLINTFGPTIVNALKVDCGIIKLRIHNDVQEKRHTLLSAFLTIWNNQIEYLDGMYMIKLSSITMSKLISLRDPDIENVIVDGDQIVNVNAGRQTRSSKKASIQYQQVPWPLRAFQSLARLVDDPRDYGGGGDLNDMLMMEEFAKEGALFGDDENEDDMYAKYDLSDMVGDNGKSVFDFDRAYALSRAEDLEFEMHDECRNDISAINDEYFNANLQVEVRSFFLNLSNTNHQMYDHCLQTLDAEARENLSAAVKAYQIEQNMKINNNYDGVVEQKKDNLS
eukprot:g8303.t1